MIIDRRACMGALGAFGLSAFLPARAQGKALRILVGYAPGGAADLVARAVGEGLRDAGYTVLVENRPGAAGRLATDALLAAPTDGQTLMFAPQGNLTLYPHLYKSVKFDPLKDVAGVGTATTMGFALAVGAQSPARTLQAFLELAKKQPTMASFGTPGAGTAMHFLGTMLAREAQVPLTHVPYKGGAAAVTDAIGGNLPAVITTTPNLLPMHRSGRLRILAVSDANPHPALPDVPTLRSLGFTDLSLSETFALFVRAGTPAPLVSQLNQALAAALASPKVLTVLEKAEFTPLSTTATELDKRIQTEHAAWGRIVKAVGYTPEE